MTSVKKGKKSKSSKHQKEKQEVDEKYDSDSKVEERLRHAEEAMISLNENLDGLIEFVNRGISRPNPNPNPEPPPYVF